MISQERKSFMTYNNNLETGRLLRECDAGIKMGISSLDDMLSKAADPELEQLLSDSKQEHIALRAKAETQLNRIKDKGKSPNPIAKAMATVKTELTMMTGNDSDAARLIADGCEKGIRSLNKYLGQYPNADVQSRQLTSEIISAEQRLISQLDKFR